MPALLCDAIAHVSQWTLGPPTSKNGQMAIRSISGTDGWPSVQLLPRARLCEIYTPFEPSVFRGTGSEPRKGIVFIVPPDVLEGLRTIETWAKKSDPGAVWHSAIKESAGYASCVKAKINQSGPHACTIVDMDGRPVKWPENWARLRVIPIIDVRGVYIQKSGSGLILDVVRLMVGECEARPATPCDFL